MIFLFEKEKEKDNHSRHSTHFKPPQVNSEIHYPAAEVLEENRGVT